MSSQRWQNEVDCYSAQLLARSPAGLLVCSPTRGTADARGAGSTCSASSTSPSPLYTLWQLPSRWRALVDDTYTDEDRNLANRIGFLLLTPIGVLIHELAHMAAATLLGGRDISLSYRVYWGYVQYRGQVGPAAEWIIAAAGPGASLLLGLVVGYAALRLRQPWRDVGMSFAHATLLLDLVLYPGMSLVDGVGDFRWIYSSRTPTLSIVAGRRPRGRADRLHHAGAAAIAAESARGPQRPDRARSPASRSPSARRSWPAWTSSKRPSASGGWSPRSARS